MIIAILCSALLGALVFALGANVTRMRVVTAKAGGAQMPTDPASKLLIAIRAHGNATEYIPVLIVLFLLVGDRSPGWVAIPLILAATIGRLMHAFGTLATASMAVPTIPRELGAGITYLAGIALAVTAGLSI